MTGVRINFTIPAFTKQKGYIMGLGQTYLIDGRQLFIITDKSTKNGKPLIHVWETDSSGNNLLSNYATNKAKTLRDWLHAKYDESVPIPKNLDDAFADSLLNTII